MLNNNDIEKLKVYESDIHLYFDQFCIDNNIQDMSKESQNLFTSCLRYISKHVFSNRDKLKDKTLIDNGSAANSHLGRYNYELINNILDIYIYDLCYRYNKQVSIVGFGTLININPDIIELWGRNHNMLSPVGTNIYKRLIDSRQESLSNRLYDGKTNPVGTIAILNHYHNWSSPYAPDRNVNNRLAAAELPKLNTNNSDNNSMNDNGKLLNSNVIDVQVNELD